MKSIRTRITVGLTVSFVVASSLSFGAFAPLANACANAIEEDVDPTVMLLKEADQKLDDGDAEDAYLGAHQAYPDLGWRKPVEEKSGDEVRKNRALRITALAVIRTGDAVDGLYVSEKNVERARATIEELAALRDGPLTRTDLAEAHETTDPEGARAALEALAARDVVATPYGYGTLARLRAAAGDAPGSETALASCRRMAATPAICAAPPKPSLSVAHVTGQFAQRHWTLILVLAFFGALAAWLGARFLERFASIRAAQPPVIASKSAS